MATQPQQSTATITAVVENVSYDGMFLTALPIAYEVTIDGETTFHRTREAAIEQISKFLQS